MKQLLIILSFCPFLATSQFIINSIKTPPGVIFERDMTWKQIKEKAKKENKLIFVDCYASWCVPCKTMDSKIYPNDSLGDFMNQRFISVKVQIDTSKQDDERTRAWYSDAHEIKIENSVVAFPTLIFYSTNGVKLHKAIGTKTVAEFISLGNEAMNPVTQYFTLVNNYKSGSLSYSSMVNLEKMARKVEELDIANDIALTYIHNYLENLTDSEFLTKNNISYMGSVYEILKSSDKIFKICYAHPDKVDKIVGRNAFSQNIVDYIVEKEELLPLLETNCHPKKIPNWSKIITEIAYKYDSTLVKRITLNAKIKFYYALKDWKNYAKYLVLQTENKGLDSVTHDFWTVNNFNGIVWDIFQFSKDPIELKKALLWANFNIQIAPFEMKPGLLDTKANLLYKLGKYHDALLLEENAFNMEPNNKDIKAAFFKMKKGKPTWTIY